MLSITSLFSLHENTTYEAMIFQNISFNILFKVLKEKQCSHKLSPKECRKSLLLHNATLSEESYITAHCICTKKFIILHQEWTSFCPYNLLLPFLTHTFCPGSMNCSEVRKASVK